MCIYMKKVLVIGAHSYIGQKFKEYISEMNIKNIAVDLVSASDGSWSQVDFSLYDTVMHLSGIVHKKERKSMESLYFNVNHKLAVEVAKKAKEKNVKQFIFMSTAAVFGTYESCITKETIPNPTTYYGKSKFAAEQEIMILQDDMFHIAIVRPPMVYGKNCKGNYARLIKLAKYTPVFPKIHNKRSMLNINNLSKYLLQLILHEKKGFFHPQDNEFADTCELIIKLREEMGKKTILISIFNPLIKILCRYINELNKLFGNFYYKF